MHRKGARGQLSCSKPFCIFCGCDSLCIVSATCFDHLVPQDQHQNHQTNFKFQAQMCGNSGCRACLVKAGLFSAGSCRATFTQHVSSFCSMPYRDLWYWRYSAPCTRSSHHWNPIPKKSNLCDLDSCSVGCVLIWSMECPSLASHTLIQLPQFHPFCGFKFESWKTIF